MQFSFSTFVIFLGLFLVCFWLCLFLSAALLLCIICSCCLFFVSVCLLFACLLFTTSAYNNNEKMTIMITKMLINYGIHERSTSRRKAPPLPPFHKQPTGFLLFATGIVLKARSQQSSVVFFATQSLTALTIYEQAWPGEENVLWYRHNSCEANGCKAGNYQHEKSKISTRIFR